MYAHRRTGDGLIVAEHAMDERAVDAALRSYDDSLYLAKEADRRFQRFVYQVRIWTGERSVLLTEWRTDRGEPLPLSHALIDEVKKLRPRSGPTGTAVADALARNDELRERNQRELEAELDELAEDMAPRISETRSAGLHRGVHLRRSRARQEERAAEQLRARERRRKGRS